MVLVLHETPHHNWQGSVLVQVFMYIEIAGFKRVSLKVLTHASPDIASGSATGNMEVVHSLIAGNIT